MIVLMEILYLGFTGFLNHQQYRLGCSTSQYSSHHYDYDIFRRPGITNLPLLHPRWWGTHQSMEEKVQKINIINQKKYDICFRYIYIYIYFFEKKNKHIQTYPPFTDIYVRS